MLQWLRVGCGCLDFVIVKDVSFSKINRSQGLRGLRIFRFCHFQILSFSRINRLQWLRVGCGCSDFVIVKDVSFSKINRSQGLRGLRMFRLCHF